MPFPLRLIGTILLGLGATFSFLSGIRTLRATRRLSDYRRRQKQRGRGRGSLAISLVCAVAAAALMLVHPGTSFVVIPLPPAGPATGRSSVTRQSSLPNSATANPPSARSSPTFLGVAPSPTTTPITGPTATPFLPIAVQAMLQGTTTPALDIQIGRLRFSTVINKYQLVAPGNTFYNPIRHMYSLFTYQPIGPTVEWSALWYQNGELKHIDTRSWRNSPAGIGVTDWAREAQDWQAGSYEVQIFVGTSWKASGTFELLGEPTTITPRPALTATTSATQTVVPSITPTSTFAPVASPLPTFTGATVPGATPPPAATRALRQLRQQP